MRGPHLLFHSPSRVLPSSRESPSRFYFPVSFLPLRQMPSTRRDRPNRRRPSFPFLPLKLRLMPPTLFGATLHRAYKSAGQLMNGDGMNYSWKPTTYFRIRVMTRVYAPRMHARCIITLGVISLPPLLRVARTRVGIVGNCIVAFYFSYKKIPSFAF